MREITLTVYTAGNCNSWLTSSRTYLPSGLNWTQLIGWEKW